MNERNGQREPSCLFDWQSFQRKSVHRVGQLGSGSKSGKFWIGSTVSRLSSLFPNWKRKLFLATFEVLSQIIKMVEFWQGISSFGIKVCRRPASCHFSYATTGEINIRMKPSVSLFCFGCKMRSFCFYFK